MDNKDGLNKLVSTNPFGCQLSPGDKNALLFLAGRSPFSREILQPGGDQRALPASAFSPK